VRDKTRRSGGVFPRRSFARPVATLGFVLAILSPAAIGASSPEVAVTSSPIRDFLTGSSERHFGKLEFIGGLSMRSSDPDFGAISSVRFRADGRSFVAVLDTGHWMTGEIERDSKTGALSGVSMLHIDPMLNENGTAARRKVDMDAEGLAVRGDRLYVSYEQFHRIGIYPDKDLAGAKPRGRLPHLIPNNALKRNAGLETLVASPENSPLKGALVAVAEDSVDRNGNLYAAILDGPLKGLFAVKKHGDFAATDGAFLPNGDLLLLERRFNFSEGAGMRIRRIEGQDIGPGAVVDGETLIEAGPSYQIDNMEGIDVVPQPDGSIHLILVSDDNHSFLQRNLMLEFKLNQSDS